MNARSDWVRTVWRAVGWFGVALLIYLSLMRNPPSLEMEGGDKLQHIAAYAVLTWWLAQLWLERAQRRWLALGLLALGIGLEFAQTLTPYRTFSIADMGADAIGIAVGWLAAPPRLPSLLSVLQRELAPTS
ncbi:MAG TPA: VanZ family protein [Burkholderiales bacterium]|nr:VanZ family protein [Burkholderiales bacterium]